MPMLCYDIVWKGFVLAYPSTSSDSCIASENKDLYKMKENSLITAGNVITTVLLTVASDRLYIDESPLFYVVGACNVFLLIGVLTRIVK
tara:strand:- start:192 stop:458 length:267 start_codon:yes stop_codon:yes gene_type:complete